MPKRKGSSDPFDFGKLGQSLRLTSNQMKGKLGEGRFKLDKSLRGKEVRKIHKGGDFIEEYHTDMFGNRIRKRRKPLITEVKTGPGARLSKAQRRAKKELGERYKVARYE